MRVSYPIDIFPFESFGEFPEFSTKEFYIVLQKGFVTLLLFVCTSAKKIVKFVSLGLFQNNSLFSFRNRAVFNFFWLFKLLLSLGLESLKWSKVFTKRDSLPKEFYFKGA